MRVKFCNAKGIKTCIKFEVFFLDKATKKIRKRIFEWREFIVFAKYFFFLSLSLSIHLAFLSRLQQRITFYTTGQSTTGFKEKIKTGFFSSRGIVNAKVLRRISIIVSLDQ